LILLNGGYWNVGLELVSVYVPAEVRADKADAGNGSN